MKKVELIINTMQIALAVGLVYGTKVFMNEGIKGLYIAVSCGLISELVKMFLSWRFVMRFDADKVGVSDEVSECVFMLVVFACAVNFAEQHWISVFVAINSWVEFTAMTLTKKRVAENTAYFTY